jgi:hypothetical protein
MIGPPIRFPAGTTVPEATHALRSAVDRLHDEYKGIPQMPRIVPAEDVASAAGS